MLLDILTDHNGGNLIYVILKKAKRVIAYLISFALSILYAFVPISLLFL